jgi:hypothetical protein
MALARPLVLGGFVILLLLARPASACSRASDCARGDCCDSNGRCVDCVDLDDLDDDPPLPRCVVSVWVAAVLGFSCAMGCFGAQFMAVSLHIGKGPLNKIGSKCGTIVDDGCVGCCQKICLAPSCIIFTLAYCLSLVFVDCGLSAVFMAIVLVLITIGAAAVMALASVLSIITVFTIACTDTYYDRLMALITSAHDTCKEFYSWAKDILDEYWTIKDDESRTRSQSDKLPSSASV